MQVRVVVRGSPYRSVAVGAIGEVVGKKYIDTKVEQWRVLSPSGATWTFYPDELEVIYDNEEKAAAISAGAHR